MGHEYNYLCEMYACVYMCITSMIDCHTHAGFQFKIVFNVNAVAQCFGENFFFTVHMKVTIPSWSNCQAFNFT